MPKGDSRPFEWPALIAPPESAGVRRLVAQTALGVADQGVIALGSLLPIILLGRLAGADQLGLYSLAVATALFLTIGCQSLLLSGYPIFHARDDKEGAHAGLFHVVAQGGAVLVLLFLVLLTAIGYFPRPQSGETVPRAMLAAFVISAVARNYLRGVSLARQELFRALALDLISLILTASLLTWQALSGMTEVWNVCAALLAANAAFALSWLWLYRRGITPRGAGAWHYLTRSIDFGKWAFLGSMLGSMPYYIAPWLLAMLRGTEETAVYAAASTVVGIVNHSLLGLTKGIDGRTARSYQEGGASRLRASINELLKVIVPGLTVIVAVVFLAANSLGALVLPTHAPQVASVARILSLALLVGSVRMICGSGLWAMSLPKATVSAGLVRGGICLVLGFFGAFVAGPIGMAVAVLAGDLASTAIVLRKFRLIVGEAAARGK